jgi:hypothetical protein
VEWLAVPRLGDRWTTTSSAGTYMTVWLVPTGLD